MLTSASDANKLSSVDGPGEVGAGDLTKPPFGFGACLAHGQFTEKKR